MSLEESSKIGEGTEAETGGKVREESLSLGFGFDCVFFFFRFAEELDADKEVCGVLAEDFAGVFFLGLPEVLVGWDGGGETIRTSDLTVEVEGVVSISEGCVAERALSQR